MVFPVSPPVSSTIDPMHPSPNSVLEALVERARARLSELGYEPDEAFPVRELPHLLPVRAGKRLAHATVFREVRRGRLEAAKVAREWHTTLEAVHAWLARRTNPSAAPAETGTQKRTAERAHALVAARLNKARPATTVTTRSRNAG